MPVTTQPYHRQGNASGPRLDNVRIQDVTRYSLNGVTWVQARTGGITVWDSGHQFAGKYWWELSAGQNIPAGLTLVDDTAQIANHWMIEPASDMRLTDYEDKLRAWGTQNGAWVRISLEDVTVARDARWPQARYTGYTPRRSQGTTAVTAEEPPAEGTDSVPTPLDWSPKMYRYVLEAVAQQILTLQRGLDRDGLSDDEYADIAEDLTLYQEIRRSLERRSPLPPLPPSAR